MIIIYKVHQDIWRKLNINIQQGVLEMGKFNPNVNHPKKGSRTKVDPIRRPEDIKSIKKLLSEKPRDLLLFVAGINSGLRMGDLLKFKAGQWIDLKPGDSFNICEGKTKKENTFLMNRQIYAAWQRYLAAVDPGNEDFIFYSQKSRNPLTVSYVNYLVKKWAAAINLGGNYGAHSLRKTFGYVLRVYHGVDPVVISERYKHSSVTTTMRYLGIERDEVKKALMFEI